MCCCLALGNSFACARTHLHEKPQRPWRGGRVVCRYVVQPSGRAAYALTIANALQAAESGGVVRKPSCASKERRGREAPEADQAKHIPPFQHAGACSGVRATRHLQRLCRLGRLKPVSPVHYSVPYHTAVTIEALTAGGVWLGGGQANSESSRSRSSMSTKGDLDLSSISVSHHCYRPCSSVRGRVETWFERSTTTTRNIYLRGPPPGTCFGQSSPSTKKYTSA